MKLTLCSIVLATLLSICVVPAALAEWTSTSTVRVVWSYANSDGYVFLQGEDCTVGNYEYFVISKNATKHDQLMNMLLAAFLSGKKTKIGYSTDDGLCRVTSIQLLH